MAETASAVRQFAKGNVIVQENDQATKDMFIVLRGNVGVYSNYRLGNEEQTAVLGQGNCYGEKALFLNQEHRHTLVALTQVVVLVVNKSSIHDFFARQTDMAINIVEGICKKLDAADRSLAEYQLANTKQKVSKTSKLFPQQHGNYTLPLNNASDLLYEEKLSCPLCGHKFSHMNVITSKLQLASTDKDMRVRYKGIEPMHYEIVSCPSCFYSASTELFPTVSKSFASQINTALGPYQLDMYINTGTRLDTFSVFAGFYLAILSAFCFEDPQLITAGLWLKLSRIYQDCEDNVMCLYASSKAMEDYLYAYQNLRVNDKQSQQICYIVGELYFRMGELEKAREFLFKVKTMKGGAPILTRTAENRMEEIRQIMKAAEANG